jgi:hypothetical protein
VTPVVDTLIGSDYDIVPVTIASGTSLSTDGVVDAGKIAAIELPTIDSAALSFQVSFDGVNYRELFNSDGTTATPVSASTGNRIIQAPAALQDAGAVHVKVRSGTSGSAVNQTADRIINLLLRVLVAR